MLDAFLPAQALAPGVVHRGPVGHRRDRRARGHGTTPSTTGADDAVNLDGGGSSTLVYRASGAGAVTVVNNPSDRSARLVPNGLGIRAGQA